MQQGIVLRAAGGYFIVSDEESGCRYLCRARGVIKRSRSVLAVGDRVRFRPLKKSGEEEVNEGVIETLLPRNNYLRRPPVANVDQLVVVLAVREPDYDWQLASRMFVLAEQQHLKAFLCLNKSDLAVAGKLEKITSELAPFPYDIICTSAMSGCGLELLRNRLINNCSAFAGPSGAGKSSLLNAIQPGLSLKTGELSDKIRRGRHTTRQSELLELSFGGFVVDTPGFTRLDFINLETEELADLFPELEPYRGKCAFRNCSHINEPECSVRKDIGISINPLRYEHYHYFAGELSRQEVY